MDTDTSWVMLVSMALMLGIRHGFDLDHLATIDAVTRTVKDNPRLSRCVGLLFSLGHGVVVTLVSLIVGGGLVQAHTPEWLDGFGQWVSIFFLLVFGVLNLYNVFQDPSKEAIPVGIRSFLAKRLANKNCSPAFILSVGALFAFSFDTFSQIALFSVSASLVSGWMFSGVLGLFFTFGMMISDGLNGFFVSALIRRADGASVIVSRGLGLTISLFSLAIGSMGLLEVVRSLQR